jgi:hypothetical protein
MPTHAMTIAETSSIAQTRRPRSRRVMMLANVEVSGLHGFSRRSARLQG